MAEEKKDVLLEAAIGVQKFLHKWNYHPAYGHAMDEMTEEMNKDYSQAINRLILALYHRAAYPLKRDPEYPAWREIEDLKDILEGWKQKAEEAYREAKERDLAIQRARASADHYKAECERLRVISNSYQSALQQILVLGCETLDPDHLLHPDPQAEEAASE